MCTMQAVLRGSAQRLGAPAQPMRHFHDDSREAGLEREICALRGLPRRHDRRFAGCGAMVARWVDRGTLLPAGSSATMTPCISPQRSRKMFAEAHLVFHEETWVERLRFSLGDSLQKVIKTNRRAELLTCMNSSTDQEIFADPEDFQALEKMVKSCISMRVAENTDLATATQRVTNQILNSSLRQVGRCR